uniref:Uncharacterized protein n=1 Tax=Glossina palpalis gambiensis TaxID=67801 RepID=A0A1B0AMB1_9MUSC
AKDADGVAVAVAVGLQFKVSCLVNWSHTFEIIHWKSCFNGDYEWSGSNNEVDLHPSPNREGV